MSTVVFVGPSLTLADARAILPSAKLLPPACRGDVLTAVDRGATVIAIIDGLFDAVLPVWHKEILFALARGVHVLGASSMGALRAAELASFGMVGVGVVFEKFRSGAYEDDDEVAVAHAGAENGHRPLSEAMVNLRAGLERAGARGLLSAAERDLLVADAKALFYPERSWAAVRQSALARGLPRERVDALIADVRRDVPDVKRADAVLLLERVRGLTAAAPKPHSATFAFEPTIFWERLTERFRDGVQRPDDAHGDDLGPVTDEEIVDHATFRAGRSLLRAGLTLWLVDREAERAGWTVDVATWRATAARVRRERGLLSAAELSRWMRRHAVSEADWLRMVHREALVELLTAKHGSELRSCVLDQLKQRGELGRVREDIHRRRALLGQGGVSSKLSEAELVSWFTEKAGPFATSEPLWQHLGFADATAFHQELAILHLLDLTPVLSAAEPRGD